MACKVFDKILADHLYKYLTSNNLLDPYQHGFISNRSTCTQLLFMTQDWGTFINNHVPFHCIYFDQKSAFDKVPHDLLLTKMHSLGIHQQTLNWISSYLSRRSFRVKVDDAISDPWAAPTGVPQGSCISPLLYNIFISDISTFIPSDVKYLVYADDLKLYFPIVSDTSASVLQAAIDGVARWCLLNGMLLSPTKCLVLKKGANHINYKLNDHLLPSSEVVRDLGIIITPNLDFSFHLSQTVKSSCILINTIFRCFTTKDPKAYIYLYKSLVLTKFIYCSPVWKPHLKKHQMAIEGVYKKFITRLRWRCGLSVQCCADLIPSVMQTMHLQDARVLLVLSRANLLSYFFNVTKNSRRSKLSIAAKVLARSEHVKHSFSWRMVKWFEENEVSPSLFKI